MAALNFALSFLKIVTLSANCWKFLCQHRKYFFWKQDRLAFGLWRWSLFLVLILCIDESVWQISWLLIIKLINESIYWHETGRISNCLNRLLHEVLGCAPAIILIVFLCKVKIFPLFEELPPKIISYFIAERKYAEKIDLRVLMLQIWTIDLMAQRAALSLGIICSTWFFQLMWLSICKKRNFVLTVSSAYFSL